MMSAIVGVIAYEVMENESHRIHDQTNQPGDLIVSVGSFRVCKTGVTVKLAPPLAALSHHYDWSKVAPAIAGLRLLVFGEGDFPLILYDYMNEKQKNQLEGALGNISWTCENHIKYFNHDSDLVTSVEEVWAWMPSLVPKCSLRSAAHDIEMIRDLNLPDLDRYVMSKLL